MSSYCADQAGWVQLGPVSCVHVCVCRSRFALQQDAYTRGMSIPFVGPWEQSSISLLGTALMRPGILPFIPHSLQLGTAHSFRYGHSKVFVYTETMQLARLPTPLCAAASVHMPPLGYLHNSAEEALVKGSTADVATAVVFVLPPPPARMNPLPGNAKKGHMFMICRLS